MARATVRAVRERPKKSGGTSYILGWRVPSLGEFSRSYGTKAVAERTYLRLKLAAGDPTTRWDQATGLPVEMVEGGEERWAAYVENWVRRQNLRPSSMKSLVDGLSLATLVFMSQPRGRRFTVAQVRALRAYLVEALAPGMPPPDDEHVEARKLLAKYSLPLLECTSPDRIDQLDRVLRSKVSGELLLLRSGARDRLVAAMGNAPADLTTSESVSRNVYLRRRNAVSAVFTDAVLRGVLDRNPLEQLRRARRGSGAQRARQILPRQVATPDQVRCLAYGMCVVGRGTGYYLPFTLLLGLCGLRPSEAIHLRIEDLDLPVEGWGSVLVSGGTPSPGRRYTQTRTAWTDEPLKTSDDAEARRNVPCPPEVVMALRTHLDLFRNGASHSERVFVNSAGKPIAIGNYERLFRQVRTRVFSPGSPLSTLTPYGLRHTSVSICLRAGVSIAETARRHGHSPSVLLGVYAGLLEGEEQRSNQLIDTILSRMEER